MVAHLWAHQSQDSARTSCRRFYFEGTDIYSYGSHFRCASVVKNRKGKTAYLVTTGKYSASTTRHMDYVRSAIPAGALTIPTQRWVKLSSGKLDKWNYRNALFFIVEQLVTIDDCITKQQKSRVRNYSQQVEECLINLGKWIKFWELDKCQKSAEGKMLPSAITSLLSNKQDNIKRYWSLPGERTYFGYASDSDESHLRELLKIIVDLNLITPSAGNDFGDKVLQLFKERSGDNDIWLKYNEREQKQMEAYRKSEETRRRNEEIQRRNSRLLFEEKQILWKQGDKSIQWINVPSDYEYNAILRVRKGQIETSKGIIITSAEAARLWPLVHRFHKNEIEFKRDVLKDVGNNRWTINSYKNDVLTAGCHTIPYSEMQEIAEQLKLAS
jgi:hypothetical protein